MTEKEKFKSELRMGSGLLPAFPFSLLAHSHSLSLPRSGLPASYSNLSGSVDGFEGLLPCPPIHSVRKGYVDKSGLLPFRSDFCPGMNAK